MKRTWLIFSLVISVLYLLYIILSYTGVIRHIKLRITPIEKYVEKYKNLPKNSTRIVVSFPWENTSATQTELFLKSLLDQTVRVDDFAVTIPYKLILEIPQNLKKILTTQGYSKNYDNSANLICPLLRETSADTKIILVNPSLIYEEFFIEKLLTKSKQNPDKICKDDKYPGVYLISPKFFNDKISNYKTGSNLENWMKQCCTCEIV